MNGMEGGFLSSMNRRNSKEQRGDEVERGNEKRGFTRVCYTETPVGGMDLLLPVLFELTVRIILM